MGLTLWLLLCSGWVAICLCWGVAIILGRPTRLLFCGGFGIQPTWGQVRKSWFGRVGGLP